jgi:hypothetical protein
MIRKIIHGTVCFCFLTTNSVWGLPPTDSLEIPARSEIPATLEIQIPFELASLDEIYEAPPKSAPSLILHIQNAHGNYEAQNQIRKLLQYLHKTYNFKILFVEGAVEKLNPDYLKLFADPEHNLELADQLARQGELTGPEYYLMDAPKEVEAIGIEQPDLYRANYEAFKIIQRKKMEIDTFLGDLESRLEMLSSHYLSPDTRHTLSEWKKFHAGHRDFLPYLKELAADAKQFTGIDLENLFARLSGRK